MKNWVIGKARNRHGTQNQKYLHCYEVTMVPMKRSSQQGCVSHGLGQHPQTGHCFKALQCVIKALNLACLATACEGQKLNEVQLTVACCQT